MDHNMPGMGGEMSPPSPMNSPAQNHMDNMGMTHMTFLWSKNAEILFSGWPGTRTGMYVLALILAFVLSVLVEWLPHCNYFKNGEAKNVFGRTLVHGLRVTLAYLVMLALMSFNVGVFIVVVVGHVFGFFLFGSRVSKKTPTANNSANVAC
uniref:Copper transport protein n=1 Tax=Nicotiana tabacum TaxID=4097 RepID=A0A1S3X3I6_TOBAC|nr:PREDICTED: copper transporter 6-like [Nicotiana tabacum]